MCSDADFNSVSTRLPYYLSKHPLKRYFLDIYLTTFPHSVNSKIQILWGSSFFKKCSKLKLDFKNPEKTEKTFNFSGIVASELVSLNCLDWEQGPFQRQPMSYQAVPRFFMSIRGTFSKSIDLPVINEYDKGGVMQIWKVLAHV